MSGRLKNASASNIEGQEVGGPHLDYRRVLTRRPSGNFVRLAQLRRLRECDQVAAVCYRIRAAAIEFQLVQSRGGRWTFPAALEAFEEAGVHGRIEKASFTLYHYRKRGSVRNQAARLVVSAHLCEVLRLEAPEEANRKPTWFSTDEAKRSLREDHSTGSGAELARVVDRAVRRIRRLQSEICTMRGAPRRRSQVIQIDCLKETVLRARPSKSA